MSEQSIAERNIKLTMKVEDLEKRIDTLENACDEEERKRENLCTMMRAIKNAPASEDMGYCQALAELALVADHNL